MKHVRRHAWHEGKSSSIILFTSGPQGWVMFVSYCVMDHKLSENDVCVCVWAFKQVPVNSA